MFLAEILMYSLSRFNHEKTKHIGMKRTISILFSLTMIALMLSASQAKGQDFTRDPFGILKQWDYYKMVEVLGEGTPIIDTMSGQAYIAGMQYTESWLQKPAQIDFMFKDIDISEFKLRFWSPYLGQRLNTQISETITTEERDSLLNNFKTQDSIHRASMKNFLLENPGLIDSIKAVAVQDSIEQKRLYDLDSLRCDTLVTQISEIMGKPIRQGLTHHTDRQARYSSVWINHGYSISLRDNTDYTDVIFNIPKLSNLTSSSFAVNPKTEILRKMTSQLGNDHLSISISGLPDENSNTSYTEINLIVESKNGNTYAENVFSGDQYSMPDIQWVDFDLNGTEELWITTRSISQETCRLDQIYTLELIEPIILFDFLEETVYSIGGAFVNGFQAEIALSDGSSRMFPLPDKEKLTPTYYDVNGFLNKEEIIIPGCLKELRIIEQNDGHKAIEGIISLRGENYKNTLGYLKLVWELQEGIWEITDTQIIDPQEYPLN